MSTHNLTSDNISTREIHIDPESLEDARLCLFASSYELLEIRDFDSGLYDETWISNDCGNRIRIAFSRTTSPEAVVQRRITAPSSPAQIAL